MTSSQRSAMPQDQAMFEGMDVPAASAGAPMHPCNAPPASAPARVQEPNRLQVELRASDLDSLLPAAHRARLVERHVEQQDRSVLFDALRARGSAPARRTIAPRILLSLCLHAKE